MRRLAPLAFAWGCGPNLEGWWDIASVELSRDGARDARQDAGFMVFDQFEALELGLAYGVDPVAVAFVPDPTPDVQSFATDYERTPEGEADLAYVTLGGYQLEFDVVGYRSTSMTLQSLPAYDGTEFVFELRR